MMVILDPVLVPDHLAVELVNQLIHGGMPIDRAIPLSGSLTAINQALYFCAPKIPVEPAGSLGDQVPAIDGQHGAGDVPGEGAAQE